MLTSWSEQSTPAELSIASVLIAPAGERVLDAAALREAEVAALADDPAAQLARRRRARASLARSPTSACVSARRLDVGADAAVPEQVDRRAQDRAG